MKNLKGILLIGLTMVITLVLWITAVPAQEIVPLDRVRQIVAGVALSGFCLNFLLSTRNRTIEKWFGGLDKMYIHHRYLAIASLVLLFVHITISDQLKTSDQVNLRIVMGGLSLFIFVVIAGITLFSKKIDYGKWKKIHAFMLIPYVVGLIHVLISSKYALLDFSLLSIWFLLTAVIGIASAIYTIFFYERIQFKHKGTITKVTRLNPSVLEWEITLDKPIVYKKGQFIFIKVFQKGIDVESHPFSISGGDGSQILLTTKNSGDFTKQLYDSLKADARVEIDGPYGFFDFDQGNQNQLWIAGGIGITPFMAYLRENQISQTVDFYYSYQGEAVSVYKTFLEKYQKKNSNFKTHFIDTSTMKMLDFEGYPLQQNTSVYMCGPQKMMDHFNKFFKKNYKNIDLHYEAFKFR